ncbi:MAG: translocation/assembly module TamB domain-containing protein [Xanthomonadales bacterium]|nr:translocation/assembly module TamB domain-containing protein [Xanthomonadales bacterium]MDZ4377453.1 translocation/assembly module TamB domain-containing protein [Xanthomonadaceae bacterium]
MSRIVRLLFVGLAALLLMAALAWAWLWHSHSGRDFVLMQARGVMADDALSWQSANGTLAGGLHVQGLVLNVDGMRIQIAQAQLALASTALWRGVVRLEPLQLSGITIDIPLPSPDAAVAPFSWPSQWPTLPLPLDIEIPKLVVRDLQVQRGDSAPQTIAAINGGLQISSDRVRIKGLTIHRVDDTSRIDGRIGFGKRSTVALTLDGESVTDAVTAWQLHARISGKPVDLQLVLDGNAPGTLALRARVRRDGEHLRWQLNTRAQDIAPQLFGGPEGRYGVALDIDGIDAAASVAGQVQRDGQALHILPSQIAWQNQQIQLSPLVLSALDGELRIRGSVGVAGDAPVMALDIAGDGLRWGAGDEVITADGVTQLQGTLAQWRLAGKATLHRDAVAAHIELRAHGDQQRATLDQLLLKTDAGQSQLNGELVFSPTMHWQVAGDISGFDPGFFAPDFPGTLSANLLSAGSINDELVQFNAELTALRGRVRGRALAGHVQLQHKAGISTASIDLNIGSSHVRGNGQHDASGKQPLSMQATFSPLLLDDLLPDAHGSLNGSIALRGDMRNAQIRGELHGEHLAWKELSVDALQLRASPSASEGTDVELTLDGLSSNGLRLAQLQADAHGTLTKARWSLQATADTVKANATGNWAEFKNVRRVELRELSLTPSQGNPWLLLEPASLMLGDVTAMSSLCLTQSNSRLCARGNWPGEASLSAHAFDLALLDPLLWREDVQFGLDGHVDGDATLLTSGERIVRGQAQLRFSPGALQVMPRGKQPAFAWREMSLDATLEGDQLLTRFDAQTGADGVLHGELATGLDATAALTGNVSLDIAQLAWLELFSPDLAAPSGHLHGQLSIAGTRETPQLSGQLVLDNFAAEIPALGIALTDSQAQLDAASNGELHLEAQLHSGDGPLLLTADGRLDNADAFTAKLSGERVKIIDNADLRAWINPKLDIVRAENGVSISGQLSIPEARIALDKMQAGAAARSPDVVILDPIKPEIKQQGIPVALNVQVAFGKSVELSGFGLDGKLAGDLKVTQAAGREPLGTGTLNVSGSYERYGKPLSIRHARLSYTRTPLDNPALDIRAERSIDAQMVGVQVSGNALRPITTLVSNPTLDSSETLSWLVLGRPLRSAQQADSEKLDAAASALGAGGNLLAEQLGARLGLDEAAVGESRTLGNNTLSVGKFVSPRLYVSYGVSLLGTGQVVALRYLLGGGFEVEIESGLESRGSINWHTER